MAMARNETSVAVAETSAAPVETGEVNPTTPPKKDKAVTRTAKRLAPAVRAGATVAEAVVAAKAAEAVAGKGSKGELTERQLRALKALAKKDGLTGSELAKAAELDPTSVGLVVGYRDPSVNAREVHQGNQDNRGLVKLTNDRPFVYTITAAGRKALAK